jgi:NADH-quinone oxidoreductase subunit L
MIAHGLMTPPFWLALAGAATAWYLYIARPDLPAVIKEKFGRAGAHPRQQVRLRRASTTGSSPAARACSAAACGRAATRPLIDGLAVNGSAKLVGWVLRRACACSRPATSTSTRSP